jgi:FkbM family methyltransferase
VSALRTLLYRPTRNMYQRAFNRGYFRERQRRRAFFREHVKPGDLVFDIGANRGHYAEMFRELGARVVAVEPTPQLAHEIRSHFRGITVEEAAVGDHEGQIALRLADDHQYSTASADWARIVSEGREAFHGMPQPRYLDTITVSLTTIDALTAKHGCPDFVKIDVEGYEAEVVAGLSIPVGRILFEYQSRFLDNARRTVERLGELGEYRFLLLDKSAEWFDADTLLARLYDIAERREGASGDVLARL